MAEIRKPVGPGSGVQVPQPTRRGPAAGRKGALGPQGQTGGSAAETLAEHHGETQDTLQQDHGRGAEGGQASLAAQGQKAAMQQPTGLRARAAFGPGGLSLRSSTLQVPARSAGLQAAREHAPAVLTAAMSHLNTLAQPTGIASGTAPAGRQEALREMSKLLRQAALQHGFNEAEAQSFKALAEQAGVASHPKIVAAAHYLRPTTPGVGPQLNPLAVLDSIHEGEEDLRRASLAASKEAAQDAAAVHAVQASAVQGREASKRAEGAEGQEARHADDARAKMQEARTRAGQRTAVVVGGASGVAQPADTPQGMVAGFRGHTVQQFELSAEDDDSKRKP